MLIGGRRLPPPLFPPLPPGPRPPSSPPLLLSAARPGPRVAEARPEGAVTFSYYDLYGFSMPQTSLCSGGAQYRLAWSGSVQ